MSTHTDYKGAGLAVPAYPPIPRTVVAKRYYALPTWTVNTGCEGGGRQEYIACDCVTREAITYRNDYVTAETPEKLDAAMRAAVPGAIRCVRVMARWVAVDGGMA